MFHDRADGHRVPDVQPVRVSLSIIVPTLGRPSLASTLLTLTEQTQDDDEVIVVMAEHANPYEVSAMVTACAVFPGSWRLLYCLHSGPGRGDAERNLGMKHATGTHLAFMDDDDVYLPGALDLMRRHAHPDRTVIFQLDYRNRGLGIIWSEPVLRYSNVSTQMILVPNVPEKLGVWAPFQETEACDWVFIRDTVELQDDPVWVPEVIAQIRP